MTTRSEAVNKVLNRLRGELGLGETPKGSNSNKIVDWYNENVDKIGNGPWCEMTNTWSTWTGGAKSIKKGRAYTVWAAGDAVDKVNGSSWHYGTKGMRAGDQVYFDWKGGKGKTGIVDHTGTVEKIFENGTFYVLEGNTNNNRLERKLRDKKYVVGYARLNYDSLVTKDPKPAPSPSKSEADDVFVAHFQRMLKVRNDGKWGSETDAVAELMRKAAKATVGYPKREGKVTDLDVRTVQRVVGTTPDGKWGPRSQASSSMWVKLFQRTAGLTVDGDWGPKTEAKYVELRSKNLNNF